MTAPLRGPPQSQLPASQTAPVAEFRCLYTPDVRKKQKKWQDGYLKFHSFNNRVMVYDQARNFLGDTYYKDSNELHEGDELTLDKGVMVEVADAMGVSQTDLKPLFEKKARELPPPPSAPPRRFQPPSQVARPQQTPSTSTARANAQQLRHKSLNTLLGTPKGPLGKSVPVKSPYEARQDKEREKENNFAVDRAAKRQKTTHRSTSSATLRSSSPIPEASAAPKETQPLKAQSSGARLVRKHPPPIPEDVPVITLDELDAIAQPSSQASLPSTPPAAVKSASKPLLTPAPPARPAGAAKQPLQTPRLPRGKVPVPSVKALETPSAPAPPSSPPVSASNRLTNVDFATHHTVEPSRSLSNQYSPPSARESIKTSPSKNPKAKSLRLSKGVKRGTLMMFQAPPTLQRPRERSEARSTTGKQSAARDSNTPRRMPSLLETAAASEAACFGSNSLEFEPKNTGRSEKVSKRANPPAVEAPDEFDDPEIIHGLMDQQLMISGTPPPESILISDSPEVILTRPRARKSTSNSNRKFGLQKAGSSSVSRAAPSLHHAPNIAGPIKILAEKGQAIRNPSLPAVVTETAFDIKGRTASPALSSASDSRSRTTSLSPRKLAALSTGGFRKKSKRTTPEPTHPGSDRPSATPCNESVALPPHPLRANKKGPVMTTTELAAMLQQPKRRPKAPADSIEDGDGATGTSPNRKFRRVRSENDAPIPSISEVWEKRNLPKTTPAAHVEEHVTLATVPEPPAIAERKRSGLAALIKKTDPRKKFVRTQSLTVETTIPMAQEADSPMVSPVVDKDIGPWSTEAFDLFDWRPPGRENLGT